MKAILSGVLLGLTITIVAQAQNRLPKEYQAIDEIITLSADMSFEQAFEILSKISYKKEGKTIIDPYKRQGRIDVQIVNLPWKKAFEVILKANRLAYAEHEQFYEIIGEEELEQAGKVIISLSTREVHIEAIFFEANRRSLAESGIDWTFLSAGNSWSGSFGVQGATEVSEELVEGGFDYAENVNGTDYDITSILRAFESDNLGRILAQPEIVVISGKEGRIQVGQDFSIKTKDFAGNVIDNFFSTGTILTVAPVVYSEDNVEFIHLAINAERSTATPDIVSTIINKSEASTEVVLVNGESTSIGGLYTREYTQIRKGVPYLKDLPWWFFGLRYFFGYNLKDVSDKELLIVIRATIVPDLRVKNAALRVEPKDKFEKERTKSIKSLDKTWEQGTLEFDEK